MHLTQMRLLVDDVQRCLDFYREVLSLAVDRGDASAGYVDFRPTGAVRVAIARRPLAARAAHAGETPLELLCKERAVLVFTVDDLDSALQALAARGVEIIAQFSTGHWERERTVYFRDPDGNLIEVNGPLSYERLYGEPHGEHDQPTA